MRSIRTQPLGTEKLLIRQPSEALPELMSHFFQDLSQWDWSTIGIQKPSEPAPVLHAIALKRRK